MITAGDFLAGGGGVTYALRQIKNVQVKFVLNHDKEAIRTNLFNNKGIKHFWADIYKQDEHEVPQVDFFWASIECTQHSKANGGREKKIGSYTLGWELIRYIRHGKPLVVGIENVPEFKKWAPLDHNGQPDKTKIGQEFIRWKNAICALGYEYHEKIMNAADYGIPERRIRYFAFFTRIELQMDINWPAQTHSKTGSKGLKKWEACKSFINITDEGESIFGREFNPNIKKGKRKPLVPNTLKRIAGGIKKYASELSFIFQYYGSGNNVQSLYKPLNTIVTKDRHVLVTVEKTQFIADHCHQDKYCSVSDPLNPILTREEKRLVTLEKIQFLNDYYGRDCTAHDLNGPANAITTENSKHLVTITKRFFSKYYSGDQHHAFPPEEPYHTIRTKDGTALISLNAQLVQNLHGNSEDEKIQFISNYFSASGNQHTQNHNIEDPLGTITTGQNKKALITALKQGNVYVDFDIRMRFLNPEELSLISTFPPGYFTNRQLGLSRKKQTKLIGNAVPPQWAKIIIQPVIESLDHIINAQQKQVI